MKRLLIALLVLLSPPLLAQDAVPEIPFDSVPDLLKLPKDIYFGEVSGVAVNSKGHVFVFSRGNTTGPAYAAAAAQLLEFEPNGKFIREIGKNLYAWSFAHTVRVDKDDNIWVADKGSDMVIKFNPAGPRGDGVRPQAGSLRRGHRAAEASEAAAAGRGRALPAGDRRDLGSGRQHLHQRRLHQFARRQGRQERQLAQVVGRAAATSPASSTRRTASPPTRRATSTSPTAATAASRCSTATATFLREITIDVPVRPRTRARRSATSRTSRRCEASGGPLTQAPGAPWAVCITPGPNQVLYTVGRLPGPHLQADPRRQGARRARRIGQAAQAVRLDPRDRVPVGERALRRRAAELARAEADAAPEAKKSFGKEEGITRRDEG